MNPMFKTTGPLDFDQDQSIYVERPELQDILREVHRPYVQNYVALLGSRQTGKTTLLYRLYRELKREGEPVAFLDLSAYRVNSVAQNYAHAALKIREELLETLITPGKLRAVASAVDGPVRFREFMLDLARHCRGTRIVILLDEVGSFISNMGFFETLRSISSSSVHDSEHAFKKYLFVFSGAVDLHELTTGHTSPLANVCRPLYLTDFCLAGTERLVRNLERVRPVDPGVPQYVQHHAGGHPYLTQRICALIEAICHRERSSLKRITTREVDRASDRMYEGDENLRYVTLQLRKYPQAAYLLRQMMIDNQSVPFSIIDPRVARLFVIGALRRDRSVEAVDGVERERSWCAVRNRIYERAFRQYFEAMPVGAVVPLSSSSVPADEPAPDASAYRSPARAMNVLPLPPAVDPRNYLDFGLHISPRSGRRGSFPIAVDSCKGTGSGQMALDIGSPALRAIVKRMEKGQVHYDDLHTLGTILWQALFSSPETEQWYQACQAEAGNHRGIRFKLNIEAPDLMDLPWEYLYDPESQTFPALSPRTPITRYTDPRQQEPPPLAFDSPLRILLVSAEPADQDPIDVEAELAQIIQAMDYLQHVGKVEIEVLDHATVRSLQAMSRRPFHVLHYIGHGAYDDRARTGMLVLEDEEGEPHPVSATQLHYMLRDTTIRLTVLNACMTAHGATGRSIAGQLMRAGLSATLAMQFAISEHSATIFAGEFYRTLADGWPVDAAVAEGRKAVMFATDLNVMDWGIPVLFMRTRDGVLFRRQT